MKKILNILIVGLLLIGAAACGKQNKQNEYKGSLIKLANELNAAPDKKLNNGTMLTGCEYAEGDSLFTYVVKVSDNRFDGLEADSIKRYFAKNVHSDGMTKIIKLLDLANVGLRYRLDLPENEMLVDFPHSEISVIARGKSK